MNPKHRQVAQAVAERMRAGEEPSPRGVMKEFGIGNAQAYPIFESAREINAMWMLSLFSAPMKLEA